MSRAKELLEVKEIKEKGEEAGKKLSAQQRNQKAKIISRITEIQSNIDELEGELRLKEEQIKKEGMNREEGMDREEGSVVTDFSEWDVEEEEIKKIVDLFVKMKSDGRKGKVEKALLEIVYKKLEALFDILDNFDYTSSYGSRDITQLPEEHVNVINKLLDDNNENLKNLMSDYIDNILKKLNNWKNVPEKYIKLVGNEKEKQIFKTQKIHVPRDEETKRNIGITFGFPSLQNLLARADSQESDNSRSRSSSEVSSTNEDYSFAELFDFSNDQLERVEKEEKKKFKELEIYYNQINELNKSIKDAFTFVYIICVYYYYYDFSVQISLPLIEDFENNEQEFKKYYCNKNIILKKDLKILWNILNKLLLKLIDIINETLENYNKMQNDEVAVLETNQGININTITKTRKMELLSSLLKINAQKTRDDFSNIGYNIPSASDILGDGYRSHNIPKFVTDIGINIGTKTSPNFLNNQKYLNLLNKLSRFEALTPRWKNEIRRAEEEQRAEQLREAARVQEINSKRAEEERKEKERKNQEAREREEKEREERNKNWEKLQQERERKQQEERKKARERQEREIAERGRQQREREERQRQIQQREREERQRPSVRFREYINLEEEDARNNRSRSSSRSSRSSRSSHRSRSRERDRRSTRRSRSRSRSIPRESRNPDIRQQDRQREIRARSRSRERDRNTYENRERDRRARRRSRSRSRSIRGGNKTKKNKTQNKKRNNLKKTRKLKKKSNH